MTSTTSGSAVGLRVRMRTPAFVLVYFPQDKTTTIVPKRKVEGWITPGKKIEIRAGKDKFQGTVIAANDNNETLESHRVEFEKECFKGNKQVDEEAVKRFITKSGAIIEDPDSEPDSIKRRKVVSSSKHQGKRATSDRRDSEEKQEPSSTSSQINGTSEANGFSRKPDPKKRPLTEELVRWTEQEISHTGSRNEATSPLTVDYSKDDITPSNGIRENDHRNISLRIQPRKRHFRKYIPVRQQYQHLLSSSSLSKYPVRSYVAGSSQKSVKTNETVLKQNPVQSVENTTLSSQDKPTQPQRSYRRRRNLNSQDQHTSFQNLSSNSQVRSFTSSFSDASPYQVSNPLQSPGPSISVTPSMPQGSAAAAVHLHCSCGSQLGEVMQELKNIRGLLEIIRCDLKKQEKQSLLAVDVHPHCITDSPQFCTRGQRTMPPFSEPHHLVNEIQKQSLYVRNQFSDLPNLTIEEPLDLEKDDTLLNEPSDNEETVEVDRYQVQHIKENCDKSQKSHQLKKMGGTEDEEVRDQHSGALPEKQYELSEKELEEILANCNSPQHFAVFLMRKIFTETERLSGNVNGCGKPPLNPAKIKYIKHLIEKFYEFDKTDQSVWKMCVKAIDSANRNFRNRGEIIKRRAAKKAATKGGPKSI
ncbi:uncharacterized protein LOC106472319 isoform X2 [Limulus polyphemus]|nr:uncharacterized protein LOC106472319 isoform X2 [Limulus polyphemus]XP_013788411.1 uncharacterized protein LOC106472319 isoform X2 [Limulus polyphemus]